MYCRSQVYTSITENQTAARRRVFFTSVAVYLVLQAVVAFELFTSGLII